MTLARARKKIAAFRHQSPILFAVRQPTVGTKHPTFGVSSLEVMHPMFTTLPCLLALACFNFSILVPAENPDRFGSHIVRGDAYYCSFDNANALAEYQQAYKLAPDSLSALIRLAHIFSDMGRLKFGVDESSQTYYAKAVEYAVTMTRLYPDRPESHFWLALGRGSLIPFVGVSDKIRIGKEVQDEAKKAIKLDSTFSHAYVVLAIFQREGAKLSWLEKTFVRIVFGYAFSGTLEESERYLRVALSLDRRNTYAMFEMYLTYTAMGKTDQAMAALRTLCAIQPTNCREQQQKEESQLILKTFESSNSN
jgi:tetratricopeptide (TPR) repeat protein